jgi:hypothetical protein
MPLLTRLGALTTLQNARAGAADGTALDITDAAAVIVEISGTYTDITANFEASIDGGTTWHSVSLATLSSTTRARLAAATATGLYLLENAAGLTSFRARTTVAGPTGSMTVRAISSLN